MHLNTLASPASASGLGYVSLRFPVWLTLVVAGLVFGSCGGSEAQDSPRSMAAPPPQAPQAAQVPSSARSIAVDDPEGDAGGVRGLDLLGASVSINGGRALVRVQLRDASPGRRVQLRLGRHTIDVVDRDGRLIARRTKGAQAREIAGGVEVTIPWPGSRPPRSWTATTFAASAPAKVVDELGPARSGTAKSRSARKPAEQSW